MTDATTPPRSRLDLLATDLLAATASRPGPVEPMAIGIERPPCEGHGDTGDTGDTAHTRSLIGLDPVMELQGFTAPPGWSTFGIIASAMFHYYDKNNETEEGSIIYMVDRSGAQTCAIAPGGLPQPCSLDTGPTPMGGRLAETVQRVIGVATQPPTHTPTELWSRMWVDRIIDLALGRPPSKIDWSTCAALHPMFDTATLKPDPFELARMVEILAEVTTWDDLRTRCAKGEDVYMGIDARQADWMDDGMFSRWAMSTYAPVGRMLGCAEALLSETVTCQLLDALACWDPL